MSLPAAHPHTARSRGLRLRSGFGRAWTLAPVGAWYSLFFIIPLLLMVRMSFAVVENFQLQYVWSFESYRALVHDPLVLQLLQRSFLVAAIVTSLTFAIGFPTAWLLARQPPARRNLLLVLLIVPWWSSYIVRIFAWRMGFGEAGIFNSFLQWTGITGEPLDIFAFGWFGVVLAEVNLYLPLMIVPLYMTLERLDPDLMRAALSLGASRTRAVVRVVLPLATPGIITGAIFVFMPVTGEFIVPALVGAPGNFLYGNQIESQFGTAYDWPYGSALAVLLLGLLSTFLVAFLVAAARVTRNLRAA